MRRLILEESGEMSVLPEPRQQRLVELQPRWFTSR
jgi:hypothetical protein